MRKKCNCISLILLILLFISLLTFTACDVGIINKNNSSKDTIQLWYNFDWVYNEDELYDSIIKKAKDYCKINNITLEIVEYNPEILSYEDYAFKRNLAAKNGNMIIIDEIQNLSDLAKTHADYTKLEIYDNLLSTYKNRFCIPIGRVLKSSFIDNAILDYYNIDTSETPVITYADYLGLKQELKKRGAKFEPKNESFYETVRFYLNLNGLLYVNSHDEYLKDTNRLKAAIKKSVYDMCDDIILYDDAKLDEFVKIIKFPSKGLETYDSNSGLYLKEIQNCEGYFVYPSNPSWFKFIDNESLNSKTFIIDYFGVSNFICKNGVGFFVHKKVTNEKIYNLANFILDKSSIINLLKSKFLTSAPIIYSENVLSDLKLNDDFEYIGEASDDERKIINATYDIFAKDEVKSKEIADAYFSDKIIVRNIELFIYDVINEISENLSKKHGDDLSLKNFDNKDEELNKLVDKKIDDFIKQLILQIN